MPKLETRSDCFVNRPHKLKLGLFHTNVSGGQAVTKVEERWSANWEDNLTIAKMADAAGLDFMLPVARWKGYGGETDFNGYVLETLTWAAGILASTEQIGIFGTVHAPLIHPIFAAKQMVTADHIGRGRFGLNIVCGWNVDEFTMFGMEARDHESRYQFAQEWHDIVLKIWSSDERFDYDGKWFQLKDVKGSPRPYGDGRPVVMNAGASETGRDFAARNCDVLFTSMISPEHAAPEVANFHKLGTGYQRDVGVYTFSYVVCRPTRKEAEEYHEYYANEMADWVGAENLMSSMGMYTHTFPADVYSMVRSRIAGGHGAFPLIGTPDNVLEGLKAISDIGLGGTTVAFVNYLDEFPYFRDEVIPRMEAAGLREPYKTDRVA